jgi:hypothetical protein
MYHGVAFSHACMKHYIKQLISTTLHNKFFVQIFFYLLQCEKYFYLRQITPFSSDPNWKQIVEIYHFRRK